MSSKHIENCWSLLFKITWKLHERRDEQDSTIQHKISFAQLRTLIAIFECGSETLKLKALAKALGQRPATTSVAVSVLEKRGLVTRKTDNEDARAVGITLTQEGRTMRNRGARFFTQEIRTLLENVPQEDQVVFLRVLETLYARLNSKEK